MLSSLILVVSLVLAFGAMASFALLVFSIKREDRRRSLTMSPQSAMSSLSRRMLGLNVDHTACAIHPEQACRTCAKVDATLTV
ncbi:hypothetical protein [Herbidospora cretacea]|uniref:hypothetical protein n=1 Tax=Herbidospora cretacea TaxID=28444 RepID=UPI000774BF31|nr:hypothetical protein [Herbidospora cretacea]